MRFLPCALVPVLALVGAACGPSIDGYVFPPHFGTTGQRLWLHAWNQDDPNCPRGEGWWGLWNTTRLDVVQPGTWSPRRSSIVGPVPASCAGPTLQAAEPLSAADPDVLELHGAAGALLAEFPAPTATFEFVSPPDGTRTLDGYPDQHFRVRASLHGEAFLNAQVRPASLEIQCQGLTVSPRYLSWPFSDTTGLDVVGYPLPLEAKAYPCVLLANHAVRSTRCTASDCQLTREAVPVRSASDASRFVTFDLVFR